MSLWRPSLSEFVAPFAKVHSWEITPESYRKGIDNAHIDVHLSSRFRNGAREMARKLILKHVRGKRRSATQESIDAEDLKAFQDGYLDVFESVSAHNEGVLPASRMVLLQISLLKYLIQVVAREKASLRAAFKVAVNQQETRASGRNLSMHERLVTLTRDEHAVNRRVLRFLFREVKKLEGAHLEKVRESLAGVAWPLPKRAFFNPILMVPDLYDTRELARAYPIARLGEDGDTTWLFQTNQCVSTVFQYYLPSWTRISSHSGTAEAEAGSAARERRDQGQLAGFLETEMLLSRFVPPEEYHSGRCSWLDEPENLRLFLASAKDGAEPHSGYVESGFVDLRDSELLFGREAGLESSYFSGFSDLGADQDASWMQEGWRDFQSAIAGELYRCLDLQGLGQRIILLYWLRAVGNQLGRPVPLSLVTDFADGSLPRRRVAQRLESLHLALDPATVGRVLERTVERSKQLGPAQRAKYLRAYLTDFLVLRRDLKLAYKTYEAMDSIRLLDDEQQVQLSRANSSLYDFSGSGQTQPPAERRIRAHAVVKADVRGSTRITEGLREKGLNPASHFGLNFFEPVNRLLPGYGAEKLFVEGDAVIIALFEHEAEPAAMLVSRACGLARDMLQVVALQNAVNRKHGLPELELGLGISYSDREPNFLYDEGRRIMISEAINRADRLSSCAAALRSAGFRPRDNGFRVEVVQDTGARSNRAAPDAYLDYNVNGIKLEKPAFFKLQKEMNLRQVRVSDLESGDGLFFSGSFPDLAGREHWLVLRYAPVREWNGMTIGPASPNRGHFFEVIADETLSTKVRRLADGKDSLPLRGRG